jgi:hypothetical protein
MLFCTGMSGIQLAGTVVPISYLIGIGGSPGGVVCGVGVVSGSECSQARSR